MRDINLKASDLLGDYQELLVNYFRMFGNKKCCANDLKMFLEYLEPSRRSELASKLIQDTGISSTTLPQDVSDFIMRSIQKKINKILIFRKTNCNVIFVHFKSHACAGLTHRCQLNIYKPFTPP